ncbi:MAG: hypothetical protein OXF93_20730 [Acidobacteria bacterium]|nr:hypothetical protein [Acidobacteriota bacterium]
MPADPYPVVPVPTRLDVEEGRGTRPKAWVRIPPENDPWLLKIPRPNTGEHWAEKIAAEIGGLIGVDCAQVELARCPRATFARLRQENQDTPPGQTRASLLATVSRAFLPDARTTTAEYAFFHGWEVLQQAVDGYDTALRFGQRDHNVKHIATAVAQWMGVGTMNPMPLWDYAMESLVSYALLDGIIGNTDRHHENWMIAWVHDGGDMAIEIMPSFDHASSLGRELTDDRRRQILEAGGVSRYVQRGRGGVYVGDQRRRAPSPLRLARLLCRWRPTLTRRTLDRIDRLSESDVRTAIGRVPSEFMSDISKEFACQVVLAGKRELLRGVR